MLYVVLIASRKLRQYFQGHKVSVATSHPLRAVLHNPNATGTIAKWVAKLAEFELEFRLRHAIKSQVLADFVAEWTPSPCSPEGPELGEQQNKRQVSSLSPIQLSSLMGPRAGRVPE